MIRIEGLRLDWPVRLAGCGVASLREWHLNGGLNEVRTQTMRILREIHSWEVKRGLNERDLGSRKCGKRVDSRTYWTLVCFAHITWVSPHHTWWAHGLGLCFKRRNRASEKLRISPHISHLVNNQQSPDSTQGLSTWVVLEAGLCQQGAVLAGSQKHWRLRGCNRKFQGRTQQSFWRFGFAPWLNT